MFSCYLCPSDEWTTTGLCSVCHQIKEFVDKSSSKKVLADLNKLKKEEELEINFNGNFNNDMDINEFPSRELNLRSGKKKCYSSVCREGKKYNV